MPNPLAIAGPLAAAMGGIKEMFTGAEERKWVNAAAYRFDNIGSEEGTQIANLIRENPRAADAYVEEYFGGWEKLETGLQERASRARAEQAVAELQNLSPEEAKEMTPQEAYLGLADEVAGGAMAHQSAAAVASTFGAPDSFMRLLGTSGATAESQADALRHGIETDDWDAAAGKLKSEPTRRTSVSPGGTVTTTEVSPEGAVTVGQEAVEGSPMGRLKKERKGGAWLWRIKLHLQLIGEGKLKGTEKYKEAFAAAGLEPLDAREELEAKTLLDATPYQVRSSSLQDLLAVLGASAITGDGNEERAPLPE